MSMYMGQALGLFREPSAIYEWPELTFVNINDAGRVLASKMPARSDGDPEMSWIGLPDEGVRARIGEHDDHHFEQETEWGIIHYSLIEPHTYHPRPTLLLTSVHHSGDSYMAGIDHQRLVMSLIVNEQEEVQARLLDTAQQQVAAVQEISRHSLKRFNDLVWEINEKKYREGLDRGQGG